MRIGLAQIRSESGEIDRNVDHHLAVLRSSKPRSADLVVFPELSISNYDPDVVASTVLEPHDRRLDRLQRFADETTTVVAVGAPLRAPGKPLIGMLVFRPGSTPVIIGKQHLHSDELPFFSASESGVGTLDLSIRIGVAICYEISVAEHAAAVLAGGAELYLASVAKTARGAAEAKRLLCQTARQHGVPALMVNSVGTCEGKEAGGRSMAIDDSGHLIGQLDGSTEGLLIYDSDARSATVFPIP